MLLLLLLLLLLLPLIILLLLLLTHRDHSCNPWATVDFVVEKVLMLQSIGLLRLSVCVSLFLCFFHFPYFSPLSLSLSLDEGLVCRRRARETIPEPRPSESGSVPESAKSRGAPGSGIGRGDDTVGNPHRAQISQFELFELVLLLKLDKRFPVEQFEATGP